MFRNSIMVLLLLVLTACFTTDSQTLQTERESTLAREQQGEERPLPVSPEQALARHSIPVGAGDSADAIKRFFGSPLFERTLRNFDPPVMRLLEYKEGVSFLLNTDQLCSIDVNSPFSGEVFGVRIGDSIERVVTVYGKESGTFESTILIHGDVTAYHWDRIPKWFFYSKSGRVVSMRFIDRDLYGTWIP